ncbi:MAG TPA: PAS domain S-box protein [Steroidobacteraceae bacterium]|jgi:PAS domain S-box-containing protein|nr:PAS domain S-box protein [Steroidobacteraceae bacterium]
MSADLNLYELLVDSVRDYAVFILDPQGNVRTWNVGARVLKGYEADEIIGQHFSQFYTEAAKGSGWPAHELRAATREGRFEDEGWRVRKDGSRFWANVIITAMRDPSSGELVGFSKITRDLTTRRAEEELLRESEERFRLLIEGVIDYAVYMLDPGGRITSWNSGAQRMKGYTRDEVLGKHYSLFYPPEGIAAGEPWAELTAARLQGHVESEGWRVRKGGSRFLARVVVTAMHDGEGRLRGFAKVTQDLSSREHAVQLERTAQHVNEFIAILAHELRNPLAPIRNAVSVMERVQGDSAIQAAMRQTIARQAAHLARIVDELLDVSRVTRGTFTIEPQDVDMVDVVERAVEMVRPEADQLHQTLQIDVPRAPIGTRGDPDRLLQLLTNLLTNAVRFTPPAGRISVRLRVNADQIEITVADSGRGIAADDLHGIFGLFVQGKEAVNRVGGGLGVGLALARRIAELHQGTIEAHSAGPGGGSEFIIRLPQQEIANDVVQPQRAEPPQISKRVLVVDDNVDTANTLQLLLRSLGHETRVANDGPAALAAADEFRPDVVLLDIGMSGMNGYEVARRLRSRKEGRLKIVAITGWGTDADRARSTDAGFDVHLVKPVDEVELRQILINGIRRH